ncbi:MAG: NAD(P)H-quinone oxidoreductase [Gammaproteobacteria bacterium]
MGVIEVSAPGGPDVLRPAYRDLPQLAPGEVLIEVAAAGVNRPDCAQRAGLYPPPPGVSDIPGLEVAGTIVQACGDVGECEVGARVCALVAGGGYAQYCIAPAGQCLPVPAGLSMVEAAALPETFFTVWSNLFDRARLAGGESLLVHGGASGIGTVAIQLGREFGAIVYTTAGGAEKCAICTNLGAARAIDYRSEDFVAAIRAATGGRGVDVILDMVGGDYVARNLSILAEDGRLVQIAFLGARPPGCVASIDLAQVMVRRWTITGSTLRPRPLEFKRAIARALLREVWPRIEAGSVRPVIHAVLPLAQAAAAHRLLESNAVAGKLVLEVRPS